MLDVVSRSQRGRICEYRKGEGLLRTPAVLRCDGEGDSCISVGENGRVVRILGTEISVDPEILTSASSGVSCQPMTKDGIAVLRLPVTGEELIPDDAEVVVIPNGFEIKTNFRTMVDQIIKVRRAAGYGRLVCILGIAEPANLALLAYMGIDVVDDGYARAAGVNGFSLIPEGMLSGNDDYSAANCAEMERELSKIHTFIAAGRLRELVDQRSFSSAEVVAVLRLFDDIGSEYQEEACTIAGGRFSCNTTQALRRPDVARYQKTLSERYVPPEHKKVLLLLPCSAKKPYHISKSHKLFSQAIHTAQHDTLVHEVIVTSPLGIVPRELDAFYPANSYDIPVTGEWKPEEKETIRMMLRELMEKHHYEKVVCHLGEDAELVREVCPDMVETVVGDNVSPKSLENLDKALREATKGMKPSKWDDDRTESVRAALSFQFGNDVAKALIDENTVTMGKYPSWKIFRNVDGKKVQLGMMSAERAMFSLTPDGGEILMKLGRNVVEITDFEIKGSLFAVGVVSADHRIRIGDDIVAVCNGKVKGVGVAAMSGTEMEQMKRGIAAKMRHYH